MKTGAKQFSFFLFGIILFSLSFGAGGCASSARRSKLEDAAKGYARALQSSDEEMLLAFVHPESQTAFLKSSRMLKDLHFSNVEVKKIFPDDEFSSAMVVLNLEYFNNQEAALMSVARQFNWVFDKKVGHWLLKEATPFGSR